jgi:hypothetical protein
LAGAKLEAALSNDRRRIGMTIAYLNGLKAITISMDAAAQLRELRLLQPSI